MSNLAGDAAQEFSILPMKLAFILFKYFPYGGLQRDCMKIAEECVRRGHSVDIFTMQAEGELPAEFKMHVLPQRALRNYKRAEQFARQVHSLLEQGGYSGVVGFNKMPYLDIYYAADPCFADKVAARGSFYRWAARTRSFLAAERAVFAPTSSTQILLISPREQQLFENYYATPTERMHQLPPGIQKDRLAGDDYLQQRLHKRQILGLRPEHILLLMVGSGFKTKGVDRSLQALAALPEALREKTRLYVVGQDNEKPFRRLARTLGVAERVEFLGGRNDVAELLFAADLLLHPAYRENTGTILLEAMAAALPLLVSEVCGYSFHVQAGNCGKVLKEPFSQAEMNRLVVEMLVSTQREYWQANAKKYVEAHDIFSMPQRAVDVIEQAL